MSIISITPAKSLLFECIKTVIEGLPNISNEKDARSALKLCVEKLGTFVIDHDPNCMLFGNLMITNCLLSEIYRSDWDELLYQEVF